MCMYIRHVMSGAFRGQKMDNIKSSGTGVVSHPMDAGNQTKVLYKSHKCS